MISHAEFIFWLSLESIVHVCMLAVVWFPRIETDVPLTFLNLLNTFRLLHVGDLGSITKGCRRSRASPWWLALVLRKDFPEYTTQGIPATHKYIHIYTYIMGNNSRLSYLSSPD